MERDWILNSSEDKALQRQSLCHFGRHFGHTHDDRPDEHRISAFRCSFWVVSAKMHAKHPDANPKMNASTARISDARVATPDQNPEARIAALEAAGCTMIRTELGITRKRIAEFNCHFRRQYCPPLP